MKRYFVILILATLAFTGCVGYTGDDPQPTASTGGNASNSGSTTSQATIDDAKLQAYFKSNGISPSADQGGLYYQVTKAGSGAYPVATSVITVNYTAKLLDGTIVDSNSNFTATLNTLISGWILGVPHINTGGTIVLYIPSPLGYGTAANGNVPANSILVVTIDLISFR